jgi:hypothetical protein
MKKNILRAAFVVALGLAVGFTVYSSQKDELALSDVLLENVEALACSESGSFTGLQSYNALNGCFCINCPEGVPECKCSK